MRCDSIGFLGNTECFYAITCERNGVGIAKKNSIAYEKGRNTNVSAL